MVITNSRPQWLRQLASSSYWVHVSTAGPYSGTPEQPSPELWLYYAGHNKDHDGVVDRASRSGHQSGISVARLRLDGFLSMDAPLAPLALLRFLSSSIVWSVVWTPPS